MTDASPPRQRMPVTVSRIGGPTALTKTRGPAAQILGAGTVIPVRAEGWGHFTAVFARCGETGRLTVLAPGAGITR